MCHQPWSRSRRRWNREKTGKGCSPAPPVSPTCPIPFPQDAPALGRTAGASDPQLGRPEWGADDPTEPWKHQPAPVSSREQQTGPTVRAVTRELCHLWLEYASRGAPVHCLWERGLSWVSAEGAASKPLAPWETVPAIPGDASPCQPSPASASGHVAASPPPVLPLNRWHITSPLKTPLNLEEPLNIRGGTQGENKTVTDSGVLTANPH